MSTEAKNAEIVLDPATGLPELPEGYFWWVGPIPDRPFCRGVAIMYTVSEVKEFRVEHKRRWKVFTETQQRTVEREVSVVFDSFKYPLHSRKDENWPEEAYNVQPSDNASDWYSFALPLNEASVLWMAKRLYRLFEARWRKDREDRMRRDERRAAEDRLFGAYPPKTLAESKA